MKRAGHIALWIRCTLNAIRRASSFQVYQYMRQWSWIFLDAKARISLLLFDESEKKKKLTRKQEMKNCSAVQSVLRAFSVGFAYAEEDRRKRRPHRVCALRQRRAAAGVAPRRGSRARPGGLSRRGRAQVLRKDGTARPFSSSARRPKIDAPAA